MIERHYKIATSQSYHIYAIDLDKKEGGSILTAIYLR